MELLGMLKNTENQWQHCFKCIHIHWQKPMTIPSCWKINYPYGRLLSLDPLRLETPCENDDNNKETCDLNDTQKLNVVNKVNKNERKLKMGYKFTKFTKVGNSGEKFTWYLILHSPAYENQQLVSQSDLIVWTIDPRTEDKTFAFCCPVWLVPVVLWIILKEKLIWASW